MGQICSRWGALYFRISPYGLRIPTPHGLLIPELCLQSQATLQISLENLDPLQVKELVEDICKVRMSKICAGLQVLQGPMTVKLNNLSAMECNVVRPFFQGSLAQFQALAGVQCAEINPIPASLNLDI